MTFYGRRHFLFRVESGPTLTFDFRFVFLHEKKFQVIGIIIKFFDSLMITLTARQRDVIKV